MADRNEPTLRAAPMPSDCNANGDIFGGWVLAQMDIAGGIAASRFMQKRCVTRAIEAMTFEAPIRVGDVVSLYTRVSRAGRTSVTVHIDTIVQRKFGAESVKVTEGDFVFVAIDDDGRPTTFGPNTGI
ncbi:acyl-CoA thioesterase [Minwuia thermotolerans]|uniref:Acyl-CoA thioesterase n=1 Tax=Minwuia thermotolerans TaxID=2056226 RepID=A0A2M9FZB4_9PROT|nr:acyl-CoA thioesterase [Minwuia thermotolerans]PJK28806.1 acyl-CoA thioesterase [Minwuia thermotolerans]